MRFMGNKCDPKTNNERQRIAKLVRDDPDKYKPTIKPQPKRTHTTRVTATTSLPALSKWLTLLAAAYGMNRVASSDLRAVNFTGVNRARRRKQRH